MADLIKSNGEVSSAFFSSFADEVQRDWVRAANPETIVTCQKPKDIVILPDVDLNCRMYCKSCAWHWNITVITYGKRLRRVALTLEQHRSNFVLKSVSRDTKEVGITNGQEWHASAVDPDSTEPPSSPNEKNSEDEKKEEVRYFVKICFIGCEYGTYRQNVIFGFEEYPVILERICIDCVPIEESARLQGAAEYQLLLNPNRWLDASQLIHRFESPFVPAKDPREENLETIYPFPERKSFFLSYSTLTDEGLTPTNYKGRLHELVSIEELARHEQIARYNEVAIMRLLSHYVLVSNSDGSTIVKYAPPGELFAQLPLSRDVSEDTKSGRLFLRGCNSVLLKMITNEKNYSSIFEAHIEDKCSNTVYLRLSKKCVDLLKLTSETEAKVQVQFVLSRLTFCEWHRAIDCLLDVGLVFLKKDQSAKSSTVLDLISSDALNFGGSWKWMILNSVLNLEQKKALAIMTTPLSVCLPPVLLLGPFGTGKTFTIAEALRILLLENPCHKILLCTHSNSAADLYIKDFFDVWYKMDKIEKMKPIRIYYKERAKNTVHPVVQEYCLLDQKGRFRNATEEDLRDCGLIVTTLATSSLLTSLNLTPTHIVIDEAAQALECEVLTALALATQETRVILAGDHMQLAPEIYSDLAIERGFGISLLERIYQMYPESHPCRIHLSQNYRAHADIINFTSEVFYDGKVQPGNLLLVSHPYLKPLMFYAVEGEEVQGLHSTGYAQAAEACELANRVAELKNAWPVDVWGPYGDGSIGVLSYYAEQVQRIRTELRNRRLFDVSVERVLNVQGKQFTVVFISVVRTRNCCRHSADTKIKDYGFLTNPRLLNTAITRAKCLVAVVGDPVALLKIGSCRNLWRRYLEIAELRGTDRRTLKEHLKMIPDLPPIVPLNPLAKEFIPRNPQPSYVIEYVPIPIMYPVIHYAPNWTS